MLQAAPLLQDAENLWKDPHQARCLACGQWKTGDQRNAKLTRDFFARMRSIINKTSRSGND